MFWNMAPIKHHSGLNFNNCGRFDGAFILLWAGVEMPQACLLNIQNPILNIHALNKRNDVFTCRNFLLEL